MVPALAQAIGPNCEVILHDLARLPNSIVAIGGNLTGRAVGGPITDFGLEQIRQSGDGADIVGYAAQTRDGRRLRSSTMFVRDVDGKVVGCLCVNMDVTGLLEISEAARHLAAVAAAHSPAGTGDQGARPPAAKRETFPLTVEELAVRAVKEATEAVGVPVALMRKDHKREVVRMLDEHGLFLIRDGVEYVAAALSISRYTIYNYLAEINGEAAGQSGRRRRVTMRVLPGMEKAVEEKEVAATTRKPGRSRPKEGK
jgi:predicted transcriptional regulator YheO